MYMVTYCESPWLYPWVKFVCLFSVFGSTSGLHVNKPNIPGSYLQTVAQLYLTLLCSRGPQVWILFGSSLSGPIHSFILWRVLEVEVLGPADTIAPYTNSENVAVFSVTTWLPQSGKPGAFNSWAFGESSVQSDIWVKNYSAWSFTMPTSIFCCHML